MAVRVARVAGVVRGGTGLLLLVACLFATASAAHAASGPSAEELGIRVEVGFGREASGTSWNLVEITASPPVPLAGRLEVRSSGSFGVSTEDRPFEVAAGATRVVHLLLPPAEELSVAFVDDDGRVPVRTGFADGETVALVGGWGEAPALPSPLNTAGTDRPIRGVAVDPAVMDLGPRSLDALDALVISAADLAALSGERRNDLEVAVSTGLELLVPLGPEDPDLAFAWDPSTSSAAWSITPDRLGLPGADPVATSMRAGSGRVTTLAASPGDGGLGDARELWSALIQLRARPGQPFAALDQGGDLNTMLFGGGANLPSPWPFALFALAFVVVVGPANGFVLRRLGRRELAWVTVPAITLIFTAGALGAATTRAPVDTPVLRAAWWMDGIGQELTVAAVQSPGRGTTEVRFPGARDGIAGVRWSQIPSTVERRPDDTTVRVRLETLQLASVVAWGAPGRGPPLEVEAEVQDGRLAVAITNTTEEAIDEVAVSFATSGEDVGRIEPGATATLTMTELGDQLARPRHDFGMAMAGDLGLARQPDPVEDPGPGSVRGLLEWDQLDGSPGAVWVTGSVDSDLGLAVPVLGSALDDRGTFVAVGVTPAHLGGDVLPHEVSRAVLRTSTWAAWQPSPLELEGGEGETVLRYQLPAPSERGRLRSTLDIGMNLGERGMGFDDPWAPGCFEVSEVTPDGEVGDPTEICGDDVACPEDSWECHDTDSAVTACFEDGSCRIAERLGDLEGEDAPELPLDGSGLEVFDHDTGTWVPLEQAFPKAGPPREGLVSPRGDVLVRSRGDGLLDLGQRGLGMTIADGPTDDEGASA